MFGALGSSPLGETELWRSNGSAVGTVLLSDIATLTGSGLPSTPIVAGSRAFFSAYESTSGRELYVTRGTAATNGRVIDLLSGTASSIPGDGSKFDGSFLQGVALGDKLVYMADTLGFGLEPHVSDGTANGTLRLADVNPGPEASSLRAQVVTGNRVLMVLDNGVSSTLWATDGNVAGTEQVPLPCELLSDSQLTAVDTRAYFRCTEATTGEELYRIESSPPAVTRVADLTVGPESSDLTLLGPAGRPARLAFLEAASGRRLMLTDGSVAGTTVLNSSATRDYKTLPPLIDGDGASYLRGSDTGGETVFRINAALTAVTVLSTYPSLPIPEQINGEVQSASRCSFQFGAGQTNEGYELLRFNTVSQNGGFLAPTLQPGALSSELGDMVSLPGSDRYYASALADVDGGLGVELLRIDGNGDSAAVTSIDMVAGSRSSAPRNLATLGQTLLMSAWSPSVGRELFVLAAPDRIFGHGMNDGCGTLP
jgi:ELWxxDGT repeat protein